MNKMVARLKDPDIKQSEVIEKVNKVQDQEEKKFDDKASV